MKSKQLLFVLLSCSILLSMFSITFVPSVFGTEYLNYNFDVADPFSGWSTYTNSDGEYAEDQSTFWDGNTSIRFYGADADDKVYIYVQPGSILPEEYHIKFAFRLNVTNVDPSDMTWFWIEDRTNDYRIRLKADTIDGAYWLQYLERDDVYGNFKEVEAATWYQIDIYVNTTNMSSTIYVDGAWMTTAALKPNSASGSDYFAFGVIQYGDIGEWNFDSFLIDDDFSGEPSFSGYPDSAFLKLQETFESYNALNWSEIGSPEKSAAAAFEQSYGLNTSAGYSHEYIKKDVSDDGTIEKVTARFMWKWADHTHIGGYYDYHWMAIIYLEDGNSGYAQGLSFGIGNDENPQDFKFSLDGFFENAIGGQDQFGGSTGLDVLADNWYYVVLSLEKLNVTAMHCSVSIDGYEASNFDAYCEDTADLFSSVYFGCGVGFSEYYDKHEFHFDYIEVDPMSYFIVLADLEDIDDDGADWVFTDWRYYTFTAIYNRYAENLSILMSLPTSYQNISVGFIANSSHSQVASDINYTTRYGEPVKLGETTYSYSDGITTVSFPIWFESLCLDFWNASDGIDVYGAYNGSAWGLINSDFFRVYSKGGFTLNTETSNSTYAYLLDGGAPFSFHVEDDGGTADQWMYNEIWSRDVQHMKLLPEIHFITGAERFALKYGCDYSLGDGEWLTGWWLNLYPDEVHYNGLFANEVWINMSATYNDRMEIGKVIDFLYMYPHGSLTGNDDPGWFKVWIDLWLSDKNASSVGAARVNAYEYAMKDSADLWLRWLANNWGVMDNVKKEQRGESALLDASNSSMSSERIKMIRYWCNVTVYSGGGGQVIEIPVYETFDSTHSQQLPLTGISDPVFDETIIPTVNQRGILGALWSLFAGLGQWISESVLFGGLNLWGTFVNFLDSIAAFAGQPKFFTNLFTWLADLFTYIVTSAEYLLEILGDVFDLIAALLGTFLSTMGDIISSLITTFQMIGSMLGGAYGAGVDIWDYLGISTWLTIAIIFYPLYLVILWDEKGMDAVIQQLTWLFGLLMWVFNFMVSLIQFTLQIVERIVESIPVVE